MAGRIQPLNSSLPQTNQQQPLQQQNNLINNNAIRTNQGSTNSEPVNPNLREVTGNPVQNTELLNQNNIMIPDHNIMNPEAIEIDYPINDLGDDGLVTFDLNQNETQV